MSSCRSTGANPLRKTGVEDLIPAVRSWVGDEHDGFRSANLHRCWSPRGDQDVRHRVGVGISRSGIPAGIFDVPSSWSPVSLAAQVQHLKSRWSARTPRAARG
jgi:hypothetical protein